jgi:hypothetical protein
MTNVGSGTVSIFPTFKGFRSSVSSEVDTAGNQGGQGFAAAFTRGIAGLGAAVGAALGAAKLGSFFVDGIKGAGDLEQSVGAVSAIFKENAGQINAWSSSAATDVGLTANEFNELGTLIGAQLKNGGTAMDQLAPKTNELIALGADLSSMFGGDTKTAVEALSSALKGERDPIERYGVSLNQAKIDAEAAALGFEKVGGTLSSEATQAATLSLIMKQTADAHGNFASEADTLAGKQQRLNAIWKDGRTAIGEQLLPAVSAITGWFVDKLPGALAGVQSGLATVIGAVTAFGAAWRINDGDVTSSGLAGFFERLGNLGRQTFDRLSEKLTPFFSGLAGGASALQSAGITGILDGIGNGASKIFDAISTGDTEGFTGFLAGITAIAQPAGPIIAQVGKSVGSMATEIGGIVAGALPLLLPLLQGAGDMMKFLADNTGILTAVIVAVAGAFLVYRTAQVAANIASLGAVPVALAQAGANLALASAIRANTAATGTQMVAERVGLGARVAGVASTVASTTANVAARVAMLAGAAASGIATAAQWALNAAMSANPIMLIVLAVAALVAGLIWFFTQTELGQEIWANFTSFLSDAWNNLLLGAQIIFTELGNFFSDTWTNITSFFQTAIAFLVDLFLNWTPLGIVISNFGAIVTFLQEMWANIVSFFGTAIGFLVDLFLNWTPLGIIISNFGGIVDFFVGLWTNITGAVSTGISNVIGFFTGLPGQILSALSGLGTLLVDSGKSLIQGFIDGIGDMVTNVTGAVDDILGKVRDFFPFSPAKRGPFSGKGWTRNSGQSIVDGLAQGMEDRTSKLEGAAAAMARAASSVTAIEGIGVGSSSTGGTAASRAARGAAQVAVNLEVNTQDTDPVVWARAAGRDLGDQLSMMGIGVPA